MQMKPENQTPREPTSVPTGLVQQILNRLAPLAIPAVLKNIFEAHALSLIRNEWVGGGLNGSTSSTVSHKLEGKQVRVESRDLNKRFYENSKKPEHKSKSVNKLDHSVVISTGCELNASLDKLAKEVILSKNNMLSWMTTSIDDKTILKIIQCLQQHLGRTAGDSQRWTEDEISAVNSMIEKISPKHNKLMVLTALCDSVFKLSLSEEPLEVENVPKIG